MAASRVSFGAFTLDPAARRLTRDGVPVAMPPKALDLLIALAASPGQVVTKEALMRRLWPDTFVEEGNLPVAVFTLRKALGEHGETLIRTVPRYGYTLDAEVVAEAAPTLGAVTPPPVVAPPQSAAPVATASARRWRLPLAAAVLLTTLGLAYAWRSTPPATLPGIRTLAVLPFVVEGGDRDAGVLGAGLAADVATRLSGLDGVAVRPMGSTIRFGASPDTLADAGRAMAADALVTAVVTGSGTGVTVSAALTRMRDGARLWTSDASTAFDLRDVAGSIAGDVAAAMPGGFADAAALRRRLTNDATAYRAYVDGLGHGAQLTVDDVAAAAAHLERAVAADPAFTAAHAALAVHLLLPTSAVATPARLHRAADAARTVLALAPDHPAGHAALGLTRAFADHDWEGAAEELRRAISLAPNDPEFRLWDALRLSALARHDEALQEIGRAVDLDPTGSRVHFYRGFLLLMARRYDDAVDRLRQTPLTLGVVTQQVALGLSLARARQAHFDQAEQTLARLAERLPSPQVKAHLALIKAESGDRDAAASLLSAAARAESARVPRVMTAAVLACMGDADAAFANLARAADDGDLRVIFAAVDPALDCARSDPRFGALLAGLGLGGRTAASR